MSPEVFAKVEYNTYTETGAEKYAHLWKLDSNLDIEDILGVGSGATQEQALQRAITMARTAKRLHEDDELLPIVVEDCGEVNFHARIADMQKRGLLSVGAAVEAIATFLGTKGRG